MSLEKAGRRVCLFRFVYLALTDASPDYGLTSPDG